MEGSLSTLINLTDDAENSRWFALFERMSEKTREMIGPGASTVLFCEKTSRWWFCRVLRSEDAPIALPKHISYIEAFSDTTPEGIRDMMFIPAMLPITETAFFEAKDENWKWPEERIKAEVEEAIELLTMDERYFINA